MDDDRVQQRSTTGEAAAPAGPTATRVNRRIVMSRHGGPELMQLVEEWPPEPGPGEVRVRILVAGVGHPDVLVREGTHPGGPKPPFTPGYDLVGTVDRLGDGVTGCEVGQRVGAITVHGSHADYVCVSASWLMPVPAEVDPALAVVVVSTYVTAYQMLHRAARVQNGERLLVHDAAGGVGSAALQLGRLAGLELFGTGSAAQAGFISSLGATPIDDTAGHLVRRVRELTSDGVDVVLDGSGGRASLSSYRALRRRGRLVMSGHPATLTHAAGLLPGGRQVLTFRVAGLRDRHPEWFRQDAVRLFELLSHQMIEPVVAERIPLAEARRAHENLGRGGVVGTQVLICDGDAGR